MPDARDIVPNQHPRDLRLVPPGSKSYANRALILAVYSRRTCTFHNLSPSDDTRHLLEALETMGYSIRQHDGATTLSGSPQATIKETRLNAGTGGTTARFLLPLLANTPGRWLLDADEQLRRRPMAPLIVALRQMGASIEDVGKPGHLPLRIAGTKLRGARITLDAGGSSQFLSALLLLAPTLPGELVIQLDGDLASAPYVAITIDVLRAFHAPTPAIDKNLISAKPAKTFGIERFQIPPDASGATYLWAAAAITRSRCVIPGLGLDSPQGDCRFATVLEAMGCRVVDSHDGLGIDARQVSRLRAGAFDMKDMPDAAPTLAVVALFADGVSRIDGLATLRHKESDRVAALAMELARLGAKVRHGDDWLEIEGSDNLKGCSLDTYDDHRMAMVLALAGLKVSGIAINNPGCVSKSYPSYWQDFARFEH
ncbi:MAG: 3-phosphoshikimate 1-carboxyvinyltransferase [Planctomycetaceae bacterium]|nr:3-phosphoshikimate 1-carboxyvinyltransferase [Planctomycetaceae bacterium]